MYAICVFVSLRLIVFANLEASYQGLVLYPRAKSPFHMLAMKLSHKSAREFFATIHIIVLKCINV